MSGETGPVTLEQERIWRACRLQSDPAYNIASGARVRGPFNVAAAAQAIEHVMRRHVPLRTGFVAQGARPVVRVARAVRLPLVVAGLERLDACTRTRCTERLRRAHAARVLPWDRPPLLGGLLLACGARESYLSCVVHHLVADSWSMTLFFREFGGIAVRFLAGRPAELPALAFDYFGYARWQAGWLASDAAVRQRRFWEATLTRRALAPIVGRADRATRRARPAGGIVETTLAGAVRARLRDLERRWHVTAFMLLEAALHLAVQKWTGERTSRIATPDGSRSLPESEPLIGLFVNLILIEARREPGDTVARFVARVRDTTAGAIAHRDYPFGQVLEALDPERKLPIETMFQVAFAVQGFDAARLRSPALPIEIEHTYNGAPKFPLTFTACDEGTAMRLTLEHSRERFDRLAASALLTQYAALLRRIAESPQAGADEVVALTPAERHFRAREADERPRAFRAGAGAPGGRPSPGEAIDPRRIEAVLAGHPLVARAAAVTVAARAMAPAAAVTVAPLAMAPALRSVAQPAPGVCRSVRDRLDLSQALDRLVRARLPAGAAVPGVLVVDRIPLAPDGDVDRPALAAMLEAGAIGALCGDLLGELAGMSDEDAEDLLARMGARA